MHNAHGEEWHQEQHGIAEQAEQPVFRRGDIRRVRKYEQQQKRNRFGKKITERVHAHRPEGGMLKYVLQSV